MGVFLITGGAGFIGSHLVERLLARGDRVVALDNFDPYYDPAIKRRNLATATAGQHVSRFSLIEADIRDASALEQLIGRVRPDAVVHLAARAGVRPSIQDPLVYAEVNISGTINLLEACRRHGVHRILFGSSSSVYGDSVVAPFSEEAVVNRPVSPYAATKLAGEHLCHTWHHLHGLSVFCLRFFTVYGPRQRPEMAIHKFGRLILDGEPVPRFGDGGTERDYTYVNDILDGVVKALDRVEGFRVYNLGESRRVKLNELIGIIEREAGRTAVLEDRPDQPGDVRMTCADISRARSELGYNPTVPIEEGIRRFMVWLKSERSQ